MFRGPKATPTTAHVAKHDSRRACGAPAAMATFAAAARSPPRHLHFMDSALLEPPRRSVSAAARTGRSRHAMCTSPAAPRPPAAKHGPLPAASAPPPSSSSPASHTTGVNCAAYGAAVRVHRRRRAASRLAAGRRRRRHDQLQRGDGRRGRAASSAAPAATHLGQSRRLYSPAVATTAARANERLAARARSFVCCAPPLALRRGRPALEGGAAIEVGSVLNGGIGVGGVGGGGGEAEARRLG